MSNQSQYKAMMEGIHAPAELLGKVKGIPMERTKKRAIALKCATAACAGLLGVFVVTNGVCYAATGETWVEKATVWVNGEPMEMDVQMTQNGDAVIGTVEYTVEDADGAGGDVAITMSAEGGDFSGTTYEIKDYTAGGASAADAAGAMVLESDDGHVLLAPGDGTAAEPIDITDQLAAKGVATGTYEANGSTYVYQVSGEPGNYHVSVESESNSAAER
ncbi:hypothetical protein [Adlercreutzia shanghongiae]|uniref:DUF4179 domain-containing protein n=1 Tax=Adlercreutzia shanghongiae TaxID=3111773 RepID=A0ABU6J1M8_9ACTN|nr:hypothetical protein [Adlercreutzia sp. R22]MEC4295843.1 hypothetical protein [Adlercreutzia sp. R22]